MLKKIILTTRHAESIANAGQPTENPWDIELSDLGIKQSLQLCADVPFVPDFIIVSKFLRTRLTAEPIIERFPTVSVEVHEIHEFNCLEAAKYKNTTTQQRQEPKKKYWENNEPYYCDGPNAESFYELMKRTEREIYILQSHPATRILEFTHEHFLLARKFLAKEKNDFLLAQNSLNGMKGLMNKFRQYSHINQEPNACWQDSSALILNY